LLPFPPSALHLATPSRYRFSRLLTPSRSGVVGNKGSRPDRETQRLDGPLVLG
jgi:hypothetical protein